MAGDWIKMRGNLWDDPRVAKLCDMTEQSEAAIVGGLYWLWATADQHSETGVMLGLTSRSIDRKTGIAGFAAALISIGWLADHPEGVRIVGFEEHNGTSAKKRCQTSKRVANHKSGNAKVTHTALADEQHSVSDALPREEKRREEKEEANASLSGSTNPTDVEQKNAKVATCPIDRLIDLYEKTLPSMPRVRRSLFKAGKNGTAMRQRWAWVMTSMHERGERAGTRLAETSEQGVAWFERYFAYVADSKFLTESFAACDLGWLLAKENFEKVLSGRYENREGVAA